MDLFECTGSQRLSGECGPLQLSSCPPHASLATAFLHTLFNLLLPIPPPPPTHTHPPHSHTHTHTQAPEEGWGPQHVLVRDDESGELLGCCPLYLKGHSQGEYVFDNSWANYSHMMGKR